MADVLIVPQMYNATRFHCDVTSFPTLRRICAHLESLPPFIQAAPELQPDFGTARRLMSSGALEAGDRFDVLGEGHQVEGGQCAEAELAAGCELRGVAEEGFEAAAHVDEVFGRVVDEPGGELWVEAFARRISD